MNFEIVGISVLWTFLFGYIVVGAIDFGAGFFNAYSLLTGKQRILTKVIQRYLSPVWEVTNVFLVFFFVGIIGFFPKTAFYYGTTLLVPVSIGVILLAIRGSYYAFETYGARGHKGYSFMYGLAVLLIPASLSIVLTISEGGFIEMVDGRPVLDYWLLFTSPLTWSIVVLSISATLYISAVFLTWYANKARGPGGDRSCCGNMRSSGRCRQSLQRAASLSSFADIIWSIIANIQDVLADVLYFVPVICRNGLVTLETTELRTWHVGLLLGQFVFAFFGYGASHYPYLLYPYLTIYDSFTNPAMAISLIIVFHSGTCAC